MMRANFGTIAALGAAAWLLASGAAAAQAGSAASAAAATPAAEGDWHGVLKTGGPELRLVVHLRRAPDGSWTGGLDSLDQGARGIPVANVATTATTLSFDVPSVRAKYEATWDAGRGVWVGRFSQGASLPLELARGGFTAPVVAGLDGDWSGKLEGPGLHLVLHVKSGPDGTFATLDSPDQGVKGLGVSGLVHDGRAVRFEVTSVKGAWRGELSADGQTLTGAWTQGDAPLTLNFARGAAAPAALRRPQTPQPPYPYRSEEVAYQNPAARLKLAGTLTLPVGKGPFPAVLLITGSGPQDRDETIFGHKPFLLIADALTRKGVAVLRVDDRGVGGSEPGAAGATTADFATDVEAGVAFLKSRPDVDPRRVGLIGHSEGGAIAAMVGASDPSVAFVAMLAGPGVKGDALLIEQQRLIGEAAGVPQARLEKIAAVNREVYAAVEGAPDTAEAQRRARDLYAREADGDGDPEVKAALIAAPWFRWFLAYDPAPALSKLRQPLLALNGEKDLQVPAKENLAAVRAATRADRDVTAIELPDLNHLFQTAKTGSPSEYAQIEETMAPVALKTLTDWVAAHTR